MHEASTVLVHGRVFERIVVQTHWFQRGEDLAATMRRYLGPWLRLGDHAIISETAVIAARGRMIPASTVRPGRLATFLARHVRPNGWGQGLSVPQKMQVAIEETGCLRVLIAAAAAALTRPLGLHGVFYYIAGIGARSLDGMRPGSPYEGYVIPPLRRQEARAIARELAQALGVPVHIVDINDNGGTIRASSHPFPHRLLLAILRDNPLGQGNRRSPIGLIRATNQPADRRAPGEPDVCAPLPAPVVMKESLSPLGSGTSPCHSGPLQQEILPRAGQKIPTAIHQELAGQAGDHAMFPC